MKLAPLDWRGKISPAKTATRTPSPLASSLQRVMCLSVMCLSLVTRARERDRLESLLIGTGTLNREYKALIVSHE